jgi:hypothetical protein
MDENLQQLMHEALAKEPCTIPLTASNQRRHEFEKVYQIVYIRYDFKREKEI